MFILLFNTMYDIQKHVVYYMTLSAMYLRVYYLKTFFSW